MVIKEDRMVKKVKESVIYNQQDIVKIKMDIVKGLKYLAKKSKNKRARFCLHKDNQDLLHEMLIVFLQNSYIRPHKHPNKSESFHIIEGKLKLFIFDDDGNVMDVFYMGEKKHNSYFIYRISPGYWHMPVPISKFVVLHEVTNGPFKGKGDSVYSEWAPEESDLEKVRAFLKKLDRF